jgi:outer membrane protein
LVGSMRTGLAGALAAVLSLAGGVAAPRAQAARGDTLRVTVEGAVEWALRDGVEAAIAREDVEASRALVGVALSYALPEITAVGSYTRNLKKPVIFFQLEEGETQSFEIGEDNAWYGALTLRQTLYAFGRVSSGYSSAKESAAAACLSGDAAAAAIARDVKTAYYMAVLAHSQAEIARRSLEQAQRNVAQISERVQRGVTPEFDKLRAQVTVANRRPVYTRAENGSAIAMESLKRLMGVALDRPVALAGSLEYTPFVASLEELTGRALESRPDLAAVRRRASAAEFRSKAQAANDRPLLQLDGSLSWQGETSDGLWPGDRERASSAALGLSMSWPLLDGFRNKNQTRQARAVSARTRLEVRQMEDLVRLEVRSGYADVESIAEEISGAEQALALAKEAYEIARVRYETGVSTLVEYQDAELASVEAEFTLSETLFRYNVALAQLAFNTGEGPQLTTERGE